MQHDLERKLQLLQQQYVQSLPEILQRIEAATRCLAVGQANEQDCAELHRLVHSLCGSGATYGFAELSHRARAMEERVRDYIESDGADDSGHVNQVVQHFMLLAEVVNNIGHDAGQQVAADSIDLQVTPMTILVADDDAFSRERLAIMLESEGHAVIRAEDGRQAFELYRQHRPELIIMDVMMPEMDGIESAALIKQQAGTQFVPIIFLTSLERESDLVRCIQAGGDDFLVKPYNRVILHARIFAMQRIHKLNAELEHYREHTEEEMRLARNVFYSLTNRNHAADYELAVWMESCGHFSGDVCCYQSSPDGALYLVLGDFTGHGLRAAIGAIPATDIFYDLVAQNRPLVDIVQAINSKLNQLLPVGQFMCGGFARIDRRDNTLDLFNAALPPFYLIHDAELVPYHSSGLPLGIVGSDQYEAGIETHALDACQQIVVYSDGLTEASNIAGEQYGDARLQAMLQKPGSGEQRLAHVRDDLSDYLGERPATDDISMFAVELQ